MLPGHVSQAIGGRLSLSYNRNESNYLLSNIGSIRYSRDIVKNKLYADFYYRFVDYNYYSMIDTLSATLYRHKSIL